MDKSLDNILDKNSIELGNVIWDGVYKDKIKISDLSQFDYWEVSCPCTKVKLVDDVFEVEFNVQHAIGIKLEKGQTASKYRYIDFYFDPGEPEFSSDEKTRKKIRNEKKRAIRVPINYVAFG